MDRRIIPTVLAAVVIAGLFVAVATGGSVTYVERAPSFARVEVGPDDSPVNTIPTLTTIVVPTGDREPFQIPGFVEDILRVIFIACLVALAALGLAYSWRHRPRLRWRRRRESAGFDVLDDVAESIAADAAAQQAALRRGAPRNAIVECWMRLEAAVVDSGLRRNPADTSAEMTRRVLSNYAVDPDAITRLATLYREARFSTHVMDEASRADAIAALDAVHAGLTRRAERTERNDELSGSGSLP